MIYTEITLNWKILCWVGFASVFWGCVTKRHKYPVSPWRIINKLRYLSSVLRQFPTRQKEVCSFTCTEVTGVIIRVFKRGRERWHALSHQRQHLSGILAKHFECCQCRGGKLQSNSNKSYYSSEGTLRFNSNYGALHKRRFAFIGKLQCCLVGSSAFNKEQ